MFADAGHTGAEKRDELQGIEVDWQIAARRSTIRKIDSKRPLRAVLDALEHTKASIRAKVEHTFYVVKNLFRHRKARYKELAKNTVQVVMLFGLANLVLAKTSC